MIKPPLSGKLILFEEIQGETWQEYNLSDGNTLRLKCVLLKVLDTGQQSPSGEPIYNFQTHIIANVFTKEQGYVRMQK